MVFTNIDASVRGASEAPAPHAFGGTRNYAIAMDCGQAPAALRLQYKQTVLLCLSSSMTRRNRGISNRLGAAGYQIEVEGLGVKNKGEPRKRE